MVSKDYIVALISRLRIMMNRSKTKCTVKENVMLMKYVGFVSLLAIVLTVGISTAPANGAAQTETQTYTIPIEDATMSGNCPGHELIEHVNGEVKVVAHTTLDPNGGFHSKVQVISINFKGVGVDSGDTYTIRASSGETFTVISEDGGPVHDSQTATVKITDGDSEKGRLNLQFSVTNGEIKVEKANFETVCD
jgi:hypothetical protein